MLEPKETEIDGKSFVLSKFPAVAGREIVTQYPLTGVPKIGEYKSNEAIMLKLMSFVGVPRENGAPLMLTTQALVDNHVGSWETLAKLEIAMMEYNCSFFANGRASNLLNGFALKVQAWISETLTTLSERSSAPEKQPFTN